MEEQISPNDLYTRIKKSLEDISLDQSTSRNLKGDIDTLYKLLSVARNEARTDSLTQLPNYKGLTEILEIEMANAERRDEPLSLAFIDFNKLKNYNDTYGHVQANHAIKKVAKTIKSALRKGDIVARYGGDEFCIVLPNANYKQAGKVIGRVIRAINKLSIDSIIGEFSDDYYKQVTVCLGYTTLEKGEDVNSAFDKADKATYKAKEIYRRLGKRLNIIKGSKKLS